MHEVTDIFFLDIYGNERMETCYIQTLLIDTQLDTWPLQHRDVNIAGIQKSRVLSSPPNNLLWIILAKINRHTSQCHLVNIRWPVNTSLGSLNTMTLYNDTLNLLPHQGLDATRTSGSNGITTYHNDNILKLLKSNSAFIRKGKEIKIVKRKNKWNCYYLSAGGQG